MSSLGGLEAFLALVEACTMHIRMIYLGLRWSFMPRYILMISWNFIVCLFVCLLHQLMSMTMMSDLPDDDDAWKKLIIDTTFNE